MRLDWRAASIMSAYSTSTFSTPRIFLSTCPEREPSQNFQARDRLLHDWDIASILSRCAAEESLGQAANLQGVIHPAALKKTVGRVWKNETGKKDEESWNACQCQREPPTPAKELGLHRTWLASSLHQKSASLPKLCDSEVAAIELKCSWNYPSSHTS